MAIIGDDLIVVARGLMFRTSMLGATSHPTSAGSRPPDRVRSIALTHGHGHSAGSPTSCRARRPSTGGADARLPCATTARAPSCFDSSELPRCDGGRTSASAGSCRVRHIPHSIPDACALAIHTPLGSSSKRRLQFPTPRQREPRPRRLHDWATTACSAPQRQHLMSIRRGSPDESSRRRALEPLFSAAPAGSCMRNVRVEHLAAAAGVRPREGASARARRGRFDDEQRADGDGALLPARPHGRCAGRAPRQSDDELSPAPAPRRSAQRR